MYRNIIRAIAVLFAAFAAAMALPGFYRMIPASWHGDYKKIVYSEVLGDFIISKSIYSDDPSDRSGIWYEIRDSKGNAYTPEQVDTLAVLENASQLIYEGRLPETVCGVAVTPECVSAHDYAVYFGDGGGRDYGLFDLKDKLSYVSNDYRTQDLFRFGRGGMLPRTGSIRRKRRLFAVHLPVRDSSLRRRAPGRLQTVRMPRRWVIS